MASGLFRFIGLAHCVISRPSLDHRDAAEDRTNSHFSDLLAHFSTVIVSLPALLKNTSVEGKKGLCSRAEEEFEFYLTQLYFSATL